VTHTLESERMTDATVPLAVLTDEELAVLAGDGGLVVTPFSATFDDAEREVALRTAYRGLVARGIVDPPTPQARVEAIGEPAVELQVRQDVLSIVTLRAAASAVVAVARTTVVHQDFWYAHVVEEFALLEEVGTDGMHRFALAPVDDLPALVVAAVVHPETGDGSGEPIPLEPGATEPPLDIAERLGTALLRSDVVIRWIGDEQAPLLGLFTGPAGAWVVEAREGSGDALTATPSTREALESRLRGDVALVVARGQAAR
jgi:hypothetical protein